VLPLLARFIPGLPSLATLKLALVAAACIACFWAGISVRGWWADHLEKTAWEFSIQRLQDQASKDRATLIERDKKLAEIDRNATERRRKYKSALRADPIVKAWSDTEHPDSIRLLLNSAGVDLPGERASRP